MISTLGIWLRMVVLVLVVASLPALAIPQISERLQAWLASSRRSVHNRPATVMLSRQASRERRVAPPARLASMSPHSQQVVADAGSPASYPTIPSTGVEYSVEQPSGDVDGDVSRHETGPLALTPQTKLRLESLGATYLMLERLEQDRLYRCLCLVDVPHSTYQRPFEAEDLSPERALERVLGELEHWAAAQASFQQ